jgi:hypothetical protein
MHEVRGVASTLALQDGLDLESLLRAGSWKTHNVFTSFYITNVCFDSEGLNRLGPIVAAQRVITGAASRPKKCW